MFNWKPNNPELEDKILDVNVARHVGPHVLKWERDRADLWSAISGLQEELEKAQKPADITELEKRMVVMETWRAQLHTLLVERGNTGKEKLSKTGSGLSKFYNRG